MSGDLIGGVAEMRRAAGCSAAWHGSMRALRTGVGRLALCVEGFGCCLGAGFAANAATAGTAPAAAPVAARVATPPAAPAAAPSLEQRIEAAAWQQLDEQAARASWIDPQFDVAVVRTSRPIPACAQPPVVEAVDARYPSRMRFTAVCAGADGWRMDFVARASVSAQVLVASADVASGRPLGPADVQLERRNVTATPDALSDLRGAAGLSSRRAIRSGDVVRKSLLAAAVLVRRGDAVRIEARSGVVDVSVAGESLDAGGQGDVVRVRNASSGNVISARVTGAGTVAPQQAADASKPAHSAAD